MSFPMEMSFNPDPNKQAIEVRLSNKRGKENYQPLQFNSSDVQIADSHKHLRLILDSNECIKYIKSLVWNLWQIEDGLENFFFHKIMLGLLPSYLKDYLIPCDNLKTYLIRSSTQEIIKTFPARTKTFESSFFPCCAETWGNLSKELRNINSINTFKSSILNFVRPRENSAFEAFEVNYLLRCDLYSIYGLELLNDICALNESLKNLSEENYLTFVTTNFRDVFY